VTRRIALWAIGALSACMPRQAPDARDSLRVVPEHAALRLERIVAHADTMDLSVRQADSMRTLSRVVTTVSPVRTDSLGEAWLQVQRYDGSIGSQVDSTLVSASGLAPLRYSYRGAEVHAVEFDRGRAHGRVIRGDSVRALAVSDTVRFFNAVADRLLLVALPLRRGLVVTYRAYNPPARFTDVRLMVVGDTVLRLGSRALETWVVEYDAAAAPTTLWVEKPSGRLLQSMSRLPNGTEFWRRRSGMPAPD
jgi:hypothetical protein